MSDEFGSRCRSVSEMRARPHADWLAENECARMTRDAGMVRICRGMDKSEVLGNLAAACGARGCFADSDDVALVFAAVAPDGDDESAAGVSKLDGR